MQVLHDGAGDREEEHVDPDAGGEQHRDPGHELVLRPRVVGTEPHVAFLGERHPEHETDHQRDREHVVPAEVGRDPVDGRLHRRARVLGQEDGPDREGEDHRRRDDQHAPVDAGRAVLEQFLGPLAEVAARHRRVVVDRALRPALRAAESAALKRRMRLRRLRVRRLPARLSGFGAFVVGWLDRHGFTPSSGRTALSEADNAMMNLTTTCLHE